MTDQQTYCHKMVAAVAKEAAGQLYERLMGENKFYEEWRRQNPDATPKQLERRFIEKNWGKCLEFARATLAAMLRGPYPDSLKEEIVDALSKDATLIRGRPARYQRLLH